MLRCARNDGITGFNPERGSHLAEQLVDVFPVDQAIAERLQIIRTAIAVKTSVRLFVRRPRPANNSGLRPAVTIASALADKSVPLKNSTG